VIIIGAKGFAKEVLEILIQNQYAEEIFFYDDVNENAPDYLFEKFKVLKSESEISTVFKTNSKFTIGIGNPKLREMLCRKFEALGGELHSTISEHSFIGSYDISISNGCNILPTSVISNSVKIGKGCIVYYKVALTHDCVIGDFVELSPGATILGRVEIGNYCQIGSNATILPGVKIGDNVVIGAGALVNKDIPSDSLAYGVPAKIISK
jgi:sugar O-acyltransferase (sialic acid O-acetyltransferase NeuD family)